jgi:hypothetical protein
VPPSLVKMSHLLCNDRLVVSRIEYTSDSTGHLCSEVQIVVTTPLGPGNGYANTNKCDYDLMYS